MFAPLHTVGLPSHIRNENYDEGCNEAHRDTVGFPPPRSK
jgi:hypothetical protein